jgi:cytosine/adenosine deaminase-related metal-dependent hydrolase
VSLRRHRNVVALAGAIGIGIATAAACSSSDGGFASGEKPDGSMRVEMGPLDGTVDGNIADDGGSPMGDDDDDATADATVPRDGGHDSGPVDAGPVVLGDAGITVGTNGNLLLTGTVVTPDTSFDGQVLVVGNMITCAQAGNACASVTGASGATVINTGGVIAPGLIDMHNHILFDIFDGDDWLPSKVYTNHNQWTAETRYAAMLDVKQCLEDASQGKPTWCPSTYDGAGSLKCEMDNWGELKGMIAGTTSIVGLPGTSAACFSSLSRSIDDAQNGLGADHIQTSATFPPSKSSADGVCANFTSMSTAAYLIHCGEGTDSTALGEFAKLGSASTTAGCLYAPETVITHATAFTSAQFATMAAANMKMTWSPASNVALYDATADIPTAMEAGVAINLGPDWSMGGSQNMLDELRFADAWDNAHFGDKLSAKDLVVMATKNAAAGLGLSAQIGAVATGHRADLMVVPNTGGDPWASILAAHAKSVILTMVDGQALYGDAVLKAAGPTAPGCEDIPICGVPKFMCVATSATTDKLNQTYAQIKASLEAAMTDVDSVTPTDGFNFAPLAPLDHCD